MTTEVDQPTDLVPAPRVEIGPLLAVAATAAGIVVGERQGPGTARGALVAGLALLASAWFVSSRSRAAIAAVALALIGCASMQRALDGSARVPFGSLIEQRAWVELSGTVRTDPDGPPFTTEALIAVDRITPTAPPDAAVSADRVVLARARDDNGRLRAVAAGDRVTLRGMLTPLGPRFADERARWRHAVAVLDDTEVVGFAPPTHPLFVVANSLRTVLLDGMRTLPPDTRALLAGFLLGDTRAVPDEVAIAYRDAGLSHLLAVSGANVAFALALAGPLLRRLALGGRLFLGSGIILMFATMTRFEPSVLRASALATCALVAAFAGRPVAPLRLLAIACCLLLVADPFLVHSIGFVLSSGASAGIALFARPIARRLPGPRAVREALAVSLAAEVGVAPVLLLTFGTMPLVTPIANLLAVPVAEPLGIYGMLASAVAAVVEPAGPLVQLPCALMVGWITTVARRCAQVPLDLDRQGAAAATAVSAAIGAASLGSRGRRRRVSPPAPR